MAYKRWNKRVMDESRTAGLCGSSGMLNDRWLTYGTIRTIERYMELLKEAKVKGYLFQQRYYVGEDSKYAQYKK